MTPFLQVVTTTTNYWLEWTFGQCSLVRGLADQMSYSSMEIYKNPEKLRIY